MSKRYRRRQDLEHQLFYARRELERAGVDPSTVDLVALIDVTLTYRENRRLAVLPYLPTSPSLWKNEHLGHGFWR
jgi:hypothetical protein